MNGVIYGRWESGSRSVESRVCGSRRKVSLEVERLASAEQANLRARSPTVSGLQIPVVEKYTYLSVLVPETWTSRLW